MAGGLIDHHYCHRNARVGHQRAPYLWEFSSCGPFYDRPCQVPSVAASCPPEEPSPCNDKGTGHMNM